MCLPILQLSCKFFWAKYHITQVCHSPLQPRIGSLQLLAFPKTKIAVEREEIRQCYGNAVHKLSQQCLTADWLAPQQNDCSWMHSKVSSDWLPSYIMATWLVLEIFKMAGHFLDSPRTLMLLSIMFQYWICETPKTTASIAFITVGVILKFFLIGSFRGFQSVLWHFVFQFVIADCFIPSNDA